MQNSNLSTIVKSPNNNPKENKGGRPLKELTEDQKLAAIQHVTVSGLWKVRLATFLRIDFKTLARILKDDNDFYKELKAADAEFCAGLISRAKPEFILMTKYPDEFPNPKIGTGHDTDKRLEEFLDRARYLTNERKRGSDAQSSTII